MTCITMKKMSKFWDSETDIFDYDKSKSELIHNLDYIAGMSVEEQTLYKKWVELNQDLYSSFSNINLYAEMYDKIWRPTDLFNKELTIKEIISLQPYVEIVDENETNKWITIRKAVSSFEFSQNVGRNVKAYVKDRNTNKILGVISIASDVASLGVRDKYIGWNKQNKFNDGKLNNVAIGTTIVATQPFGFNFNGGKLIAALTTSATFRNYWKETYDNVLVGITTTALYGVASMYNSIPLWKTLGETKGMVSIKPDDKYYSIWHQYVKEKYPVEYHKAMNATGPKQRVLKLIYKELGINSNQYNHGFRRGAYYASIYENGNQFLCNNLTEDKLIMKDKFAKDIDYIMDWWKPKAVNRYTNMFNENKLKPETLYYSDIIGISWEECKQKYLGEVGR